MNQRRTQDESKETPGTFRWVDYPVDFTFPHSSKFCKRHKRTKDNGTVFLDFYGNSRWKAKPGLEEGGLGRWPKGRPPDCLSAPYWPNGALREALPRSGQVGSLRLVSTGLGFTELEEQGKQL